MEEEGSFDGFIHETQFQHNEFHQKVIDYMIMLGFYVAPILTFKNKAQGNKAHLYWLIQRFISPKLANFLRKVSPPLRAEYNRDRSIWFYYRDPETNKLIKEIMLIPIFMFTPGGS